MSVTKNKQGRLRWRKNKRENIRQAETHSFTNGTADWLVMVQKIDAGWFWYGMGRNTAHSPVATLEEAKREAEAHARETLAQATQEKTR